MLGELNFSGRTGPAWHLQVDGIDSGTLYAFKAAGADNRELGLAHDAERVVLDPYVKQLNRGLSFNQRLYQTKSHYMLAKGVLKPSSLIGRQC